MVPAREGSCCEILFRCGFYPVFGNQFIVAMGYPADRFGLQEACGLSGNDELDFKSTRHAITSVCVSVDILLI